MLGQVVKLYYFRFKFFVTKTFSNQALPYQVIHHFSRSLLNFKPNSDPSFSLGDNEYSCFFHELTNIKKKEKRQSRIFFAAAVSETPPASSLQTLQKQQWRRATSKAHHSKLNLSLSYGATLAFNQKGRRKRKTCCTIWPISKRS